MRVDLVGKINVNFDLLKYQIKEFRSKYSDETQFCITSKLGDNNFIEGAGKTSLPENFIYLNTYFQDTEAEKLVKIYPDYYRWRILCVEPRKTYSIHHDNWKKGFNNQRIHFPIDTNPDAYLVFFDEEFSDHGTQKIEYHNLKAEYVYLVDTTGFHTAVNYHPTSERIHIVAERFIANE